MSCFYDFTFPRTKSSHLKMDGWKMSFLLGPGATWQVRTVPVSSRECKVAGGSCSIPWKIIILSEELPAEIEISGLRNPMVFFEGKQTFPQSLRLFNSPRMMIRLLLKIVIFHCNVSFQGG